MDTRLPARALLASGMPLSLFAVVPGFLFARGSTLGPLSTRSMPAARFPRAPVTKSNPGGAYGDFSGFSFLEVGPSTMVPRVGRVIPTPPGVFPTTSPETTRDSAPICPRDMWPSWPCTEHGGQGWEVIIDKLAQDRTKVLVRFLAPSARTRKWKPMWLLLDHLRPI